MKTQNGFLLVEQEANNSKIIIQGDTPVMKVIVSGKGSDYKKGDRVLYTGQKASIKADDKTYSFINEDTVIAVL